MWVEAVGRGVKADAAGAQAFDFPAFQGDAGFVVFLDEILVSRFFVLGDGGAAAFLFRFLAHGAQLYATAGEGCHRIEAFLDFGAVNR